MNTACLVKIMEGAYSAFVYAFSGLQSTNMNSNTVSFFSQQYSCPSYCPCRLPESQRVDVFTLSSLEEVTICSHSKSYEELEFVQQLSKCNARSLKKLVTVHDNERFRVHVESNEVTEKIRSLYPPNVKVKFYVIRHGRWVPLD